MFLSPASPVPVRWALLCSVQRCWHDGQLARFIAALEKQTLAPENFSLTLLVHNSAESAATRDEAYRENQDLLAWLGAKAAELPFALHVLDYTKQGTELSAGALRLAAADDYAGRQPAEALARTLVLALEPDVALPASLLAEVGAVYARYPELEALFLARDQRLSAAPGTALLFTHQRVRLRKALTDFHEARRYFAEGVASYQVSARFAPYRAAAALAAPRDEDLSLVLHEKARWSALAAPAVSKEDGVRAEGFARRRRKEDAAAVEPEKRPWWWRAWVRFGGHAGLLAPLKIARPRAGAGFPLYRELFHPLALALWAEVREGRLSYAKACEELGRYLQRFLLRPLRKHRRPRLGLLSLAELRALPEEVPLSRRSKRRLNALAHPFARLFLHETRTPGSDLWRLLTPHLSDEERDRAERERASAAERMDEAMRSRREQLLRYFREGELPAGNDPFLAWLRETGKTLFAPAQRAVAAGRASPEELVERAAELLPDWLERFEFATYAREAELVRILTRLAVRARTHAPAPGLERALALLAHEELLSGAPGSSGAN